MANNTSVALETARQPRLQQVKRTARSTLPRLWRIVNRLKRAVIVFFQKRLISKGETIYLGASDQDRWVIEDVFDHRRGGFFLELGAYDGFFVSNTYILEKRYGWTGICIEPDPSSFARLTRERTCICVHACVDGLRRDVRYLYNESLGGIIDTDTDMNPAHAAPTIEQAQKLGNIETVQTRTLQEILAEQDAPKVIDFFSLDVEGAETRILRDFPFDEYTFLSLVVERASEELNQILKRNGYHFVELRVGDSFYVHESLPNFSLVKKQRFRQVPPKPAPLEKNFEKKLMTFSLAVSSFFG